MTRAEHIEQLKNAYEAKEEIDLFGKSVRIKGYEEIVENIHRESSFIFYFSDGNKFTFIPETFTNDYFCKRILHGKLHRF